MNVNSPLSLDSRAPWLRKLAGQIAFWFDPISGALIVQMVGAPGSEASGVGLRRGRSRNSPKLFVSSGWIFHSAGDADRDGMALIRQPTRVPLTASTGVRGIARTGCSGT